MRLRIPHPALAALILLLVAPLVGCGGGAPLVLVPRPDPLAGMPAPSSPTGTMRAFEWSWNTRSTDGYRQLFTSDYVFVFAAADSAGNRYRDQPFLRADEELCFAHIAAAASSIRLTLDRSFVVNEDLRPGKYDLLRRKNIRTQVSFDLVTTDGSRYDIAGKANLFLVRGDAAAIPAELGAGADSTRWYIERWEDETLSGAEAGFRVAPSRNDTFGQLKSLYR